MKKRVFNLLIVDESGSMNIIREQALAGINETLSTVRAAQKNYPDTEQFVTLVTFDSSNKKYHYDNVPVEQTHDLKWSDYEPCAATPLYDTMGMSISKLRAQVQEGDNVLVTVITDGEENCSREWTLKMVRNLVEQLKQQNWTFTLIGTDNLDVEGMAGNMAISNHLKFAERPEETRKMFKKERRSREHFYSCLSCSMPITDGSYFIADEEDED